MAWTHTWLGLIVGWVLFYIYLTGTLGYLDKEIDYWMAPDKQYFASQASSREQISMAQARLSTVAADAATWNIQLIGGREARWLEISWAQTPAVPDQRPDRIRETLNPITGETIDNSARATGGGQLLYRMHYSLAYMPLNTAIWIVMICTVIMFTGMITGIIAHKKIFKDFFTFRPGKGQRSWLDGHNLLSVASLPFHLVVTYSGLLFFVFLFVPYMQNIVFQPEPGKSVQQQVYQSEESRPAMAESADIAAPLIELSSLVDKVNNIWGEGKITSLEIKNPGDANARVTIKPQAGDTVAVPDYGLVFDGVSGKLLENYNGPYAFGAVDEFLKGIHRGLFAGPFLRILYLFMGFAGTAMIGTGLLLWSNKRTSRLLAKNQKPHLGIALVDRLNLGTIVGLPIAITAYFWANRLLPVSMETRATWEIHVMYATLAVCFIYPLWRPLNKAWVELLWLASVALCLLPVINAFTTERHLAISIMQGDWIMAGFDLSAFSIGIVFAAFAFKMQKRVALHVTSKAPLHPTTPETSTQVTPDQETTVSST